MGARSHQRRCMTLIEIMIVVVIISMFTGVAGTSIYKGVLQERFRASVEAVEAQLQMAQGLMLAHDGDARVDIVLDGERITACVRTEIELSPSLASLQCRSGRGVDSVWFEDRQQRVFRDSVTMEFLSGGSVISHGRLVLEGAGGQATIVLPGYPAPISRLSEKEYEVIDGDNLYPWDLVNQIQEAVPTT